MSTEDRPNRADKTSRYRLSVEGVLDEYVKRASPSVAKDELRARILEVLRDDRVATNANGQPIDLLTDDGREA
jgi:hypothetical protein